MPESHSTQTRPTASRGDLALFELAELMSQVSSHLVRQERLLQEQAASIARLTAQNAVQELAIRGLRAATGWLGEPTDPVGLN